MNQKKKLVWFDCDPGHDDMLALIIALQDININILGITVSAGNADLENLEKNTLGILKLFNKDKEIPVLVGSSEKYDGGDFQFSGFHGKSGLDGVKLEWSDQKGIRENIYNYTFEVFKNQEQKVNIVAIGPLTNVCILLKQKPEIKQFIEQISIMGGGNELGNVTKNAEFNFYMDPCAANYVLNSGVKQFLAPLNLTHTVNFQKQHFQILETIKSSNKLAQIIYDSMTYYKKKYEECHNLQDIVAMHDPLAIYYVIKPENFQTKLANIKVETQKNDFYGKSYFDFQLKHLKEENKVLVGISTKQDLFFDYLISLIQSFQNKN